MAFNASALFSLCCDMIDLANDEKRGRLLKAIKASREAMEKHRRVRKKMVELITKATG